MLHRTCNKTLYALHFGNKGFRVTSRKQSHSTSQPNGYCHAFSLGA